ncbi:MAG TPA: GxxExxY protein [Terriglobales bacterium]|nr:GxxExxY protein [Terriglobales bacterium]
MDEKDQLDQITRRIIGAAIEVHRALGPGLLESAYEACLAFELAEAKFKVERQKPLPIVYKEVTLDCGYRLDLLVEDRVVVEVKAVDEIAPIHTAQLLSYLRLLNKRVGLLINFHVRVLKDGITRVVNDFPDAAKAVTSTGVR